MGLFGCGGACSAPEERADGRPADRARVGLPRRDLDQPPDQDERPGPGRRRRLKEPMTDLLTADRIELQHQGGAVGAEDRGELVVRAERAVTFYKGCWQAAGHGCLAVGH